MNSPSVGIVGAGLAGLTAAYYLKKKGIDNITLFESADKSGGKVQTETVDGFTLNRGFQVFLPSYPEAARVLDYEKLDLKAFDKGSVIIKNGKKIPFYDPASSLKNLLISAIKGPGTLMDKLKLLFLKIGLTGKSSTLMFDGSEESTMAYLKRFGFSTAMIHDFWTPFYQGIFLENDLHTSRQLFEFTFKMFIESGAVIPSKGMQAIPDHLVDYIGKEKIKLNEAIVRVEANTLITAKEGKFPFDHIILATDALNRPDNFNHDAMHYKAVTNMYFSAGKIPFLSKHIILNASPSRVVNNVAFMSQVAPAYSPEGIHLISVSGNGLHHDPEDFKKDLAGMFGPEVKEWKHIKSYAIPFALPDCKIQDFYQVKNGNGHYVCGDYHLQGSINGAMKSGRMAAEALLNDLK